MGTYKQAYNSGGAEINFKTQAASVYFEDGNTLPKTLDDLEDRLSGSSTRISTVQYAASSEFIENDKWNDYKTNAAWQDTMPTLDSSKPYLYLKITFTNEDNIITFAGSLGKSGEAGVGIEWVYKATALDSDAVIERLKKELIASMDDKYQNPEKVPTNWTDSLPEPTDKLPIVFGARRIYKNGTWEAWSAPIIVARKFTITDGENTFLKKTEEDTAQKRITFEDGITTKGDVEFNNQEGKTNTTQINTDLNVTGAANFKNITVSGQAHFSTLVLDEIKAAGGTYLFSVANPFTVEYKEDVDGNYKLWWKAESENSLNTWAENDYAICAQWDNVKEGATVAACNKYYWAKVTKASSDPTHYNDSEDFYHWIIISSTDTVKGCVLDPEIGDNISQLGNSSDTDRQSAIVISAYHWVDANVACPAFVQYTGISSFSLDGCIRNKIDKKGTTLKGDFSSESGGTFVTEEGIQETITNQISSSINGLNLLTQNATASAGLTITPDTGITLDASKTTIKGDLNLKGLITDSITQVDNSKMRGTYSKLIPINMEDMKSVEVTPSGELCGPPMVLLPMYTTQTIADITIPAYTESGTHLIIRNPFNPNYSLWNTADSSNWDTTSRTTIMQQLVVICADSRILQTSNYHDSDKATISPDAITDGTDYAGGVYFNGRRGRFICLLPGQQVELTSIVATQSDGAKYLSWYVSGNAIEVFDQTIDFVNGTASVAATYQVSPSGAVWGTSTDKYQDAIFGYSRLTSSDPWEIDWEDTKYPYLTVN